MKIAIANASTLVADADAEVIAQALAHSLDVFASQWDRETPEVGFTTDPASAGLGEGDCLLVLLDDADQAGDLGYHSVTPDGRPYSRVFARDSIAGLSGNAPASISGTQPRDVVLAFVAPVCDHEGKEALADAFANDWADDGSGKVEWALEVCDPVESTLDPTPITLADGSVVNVTLSDHVLPAFFDSADATGPWDHSGVLTGPFSLAAGGYAILQAEDPTSVQAVWGDQATDAGGGRFVVAGAGLDDWRKAAHEARHPASRTGKRLDTHEVGGEAAVTPGPGTGPDEGPGPEVPTGEAGVSGGPDAGGEPIPPGAGGVPAGVDPNAEPTGAAAEPSTYPEPVPGPGPGTAIIRQDNVSEPGVQHTSNLGPDGEVVHVSHETNAGGTAVTLEGLPADEAPLAAPGHPLPDGGVATPVEPAGGPVRDEHGVPLREEPGMGSDGAPGSEGVQGGEV